MSTLEDALLVDVAPDGWDHPAGEPPGTRLRMDVHAATLDVDAHGGSTGWAWLRGRRLLPGGSTRSGKALVRITALPGNLRIRHQGAVVEIRELQQTHGLGRGQGAQGNRREQEAVSIDKGIVQQPGTGDAPRWDKGQQVVGTERQTLAKELVERYSDGASIRTLAASIGRSYGFVHRVLTESGVSLRARGGARPLRTRRTEQG